MTEKKLKLFEKMLAKRKISAALDNTANTGDAGYSLGVAALVADIYGGKERVGFAYRAGVQKNLDMRSDVLYVGYDTEKFSANRGVQRKLRQKVINAAVEAGLYVAIDDADDKTICLAVAEFATDLNTVVGYKRVA